MLGMDRVFRWSHDLVGHGDSLLIEQKPVQAHHDYRMRRKQYGGANSGR